ncbi:MAG: hypothetical protein LBC74_00895 [Planctomycetaceae bacterium]|jgi:hypothetical protein|nr:hypothetical protein [Planctomycetaceae bacterium]
MAIEISSVSVNKQLSMFFQNPALVILLNFILRRQQIFQFQELRLMQEQLPRKVQYRFMPASMALLNPMDQKQLVLLLLNQVAEELSKKKILEFGMYTIQALLVFRGCDI